jgi:hypothetical protein
MRDPAYLGIDASKTSLGLCAIPRSWDGDWSRVCRETLGIAQKNRTEREQIQYMLDLARDVRIFAVRCNVTVAVIEDVPTHDAFSIKPLAELRGFIRSELARECGIYVEPVNQSSARKTFLGYLPTSRKGGPKVNRKQVVTAALDALTDVFVWDDEKDAFVTVNHRMARDPGVHVIQLHAPNPNDIAKAAKKPRKAKAA